MDADKAHREKARWELNKNAMNYIEQILEATSHKNLTPIPKTIQIRQTRHARHSRRSKEELISDVLLRTPAHRCASVGQQTRTYIQQLCTDTGCSLEELPGTIGNWDEWRERESGKSMLVV